MKGNGLSSEAPVLIGINIPFRPFSAVNRKFSCGQERPVEIDQYVRLVPAGRPIAVTVCLENTPAEAWALMEQMDFAEDYDETRDYDETEDYDCG